MAGYKETPRQKMIAMMYLVLTALLALNVSKEMLDAFIVVNDSVELTNENFSQKLNETYLAFEKKYQINQNKVRPYWEKAKIAKAYSTELVDYINNMKYELIAKTEKIPIDSARVIKIANIKNKDDYDTPTNYFMGESDAGKDGAGIKLKEKIEGYRTNMLNLLDAADREKIKMGLETEGNYKDLEGLPLNWIQYNFYHTILAADIAIINKIITEVFNAEFDVVNFLLDDIEAEDFKYDKIAAKVLPKSSYVFMGDKYEAEIIVAAYDTKQTPDVFLLEGIDSLPLSQVGRAKSIIGKHGIVKFELPATSQGFKKYAGIIQVKGGQGEINNHYFNDEYFVAQPSLTVSATKMNVFYIGVENPVEISVPGIPEENITPSISAGTLTKNPNGNDWIVSVPSGQRETTITVNAKVDGQSRVMGTKKYRIKKLPDPTAQIANINEGSINRNILIASGAIIPKMPDDFEFDLKYKIVSFKMVLQRGTDIFSEKSNNNLLTQEMIKAIQGTNRGQRIWFENIIARGPDNVDRPLPPIILTIN